MFTFAVEHTCYLRPLISGQRKLIIDKQYFLLAAAKSSLRHMQRTICSWLCSTAADIQLPRQLNRRHGNRSDARSKIGNDSEMQQFFVFLTLPVSSQMVQCARSDSTAHDNLRVFAGSACQCQVRLPSPA